MANYPDKVSSDDPRLALETLREENNVKAAACGAKFSTLLAFNRLIARASRVRLSESAEICPSHGRRWRRRALLGLGSVSTFWIALSPQAHMVLGRIMLLALHLCQHVMGH